MKQDVQFGDRLKKLRKERKYTLDSLAEEYNQLFEGGLNKGTLSKYENSKQRPMADVVSNLALLLGVTVDYLLAKDVLEKTIIMSSHDELVIDMWRKLSPIRKQMVSDLVLVSWKRDQGENYTI